MSASFAVAAILVAVALLAIRLTRRGRVGAAAALGRAFVAEVPATPEAEQLLERWRDRAARWRRSVAVPVVLVTLGASIVLRGSVDVGTGAHPAWADPLLTGLLAVFLASIAAEFHHLRNREPGPRTVSLLPREVGVHLRSGSRLRLVVLAAAATIATVLTVTVGSQPFPSLGLLALVVAGLVPVVQRGIVLRARPALPDDLRAADDAVRALAVHSVDEAGAGAALLLVAWQLAPIYSSAAVPTPIQVLMVAAQLAALVVAIVWCRRSNPHRLLPDAAALNGPEVSTDVATLTEPDGFRA